MGVIKRYLHLPEYSDTKLRMALEELGKHGQVNACNNNKMFDVAIGATYTGNYERKSIKRSNLNKCNFEGADFTRVAATGSKFLNSTFLNCTISGANFQFCDFSGTDIENKSNNISVDGTNFSESIFAKSTLKGLNIIACSFSQVLFYDTTIKECRIRSTTFENATFKKCLFENLELRNLNIEYAEFINCDMNNVVLPFSQIPYTFGGLSYLSGTKDEVFISSKINEHQKISIEEYFDMLKYLEIFYLSLNEFFPLANIYLAQNKIEYAFQAIVNGLIYSVQFKDFRMLKFFCRLASTSNCFSNVQLRELYNKIHEIIPVEYLNLSELHTYEIHIGEIRSLLLNGESNRLKAQINLKTNIEIENGIGLGQFIQVLNKTIRFSSPDLKLDLIEIRHNSPYELFLQLSSNDYTIIVSSVVFLYTVLMKSNKLFQEFCNSALKHLELKKEKLEAKELKKMSKELEKNDIKIIDAKHQIVGSDFYSSSSSNESLIRYHFKESGL